MPKTTGWCQSWRSCPFACSDSTPAALQAQVAASDSSCSPISRLAERSDGGLIEAFSNSLARRIDANLRRRVVALEILLADGAAVLDGHSLALQPIPLHNPRCQRRLRNERQARLRQRPSIRRKLWPHEHRLRRRDARVRIAHLR